MEHVVIAGGGVAGSSISFPFAAAWACAPAHARRADPDFVYGNAIAGADFSRFARVHVTPLWITQAELVVDALERWTTAQAARGKPATRRSVATI